jgi:hypothetical protein
VKKYRVCYPVFATGEVEVVVEAASEEAAVKEAVSKCPEGSEIEWHMDKSFEECCEQAKIEEAE